MYQCDDLLPLWLFRIAFEGNVYCLISLHFALLPVSCQQLVQSTVLDVRQILVLLRILEKPKKCSACAFYAFELQSADVIGNVRRPAVFKPS